MLIVCILRSTIQQRFYIGHTKDLSKRIQTHNVGSVRSTKAYRPWSTIHTETYSSKQEAHAREMQIKSYKGGEAFKKLMNKKEAQKV
ncbi:MAG: GIY-YIG nuclease family protein [Candidatus Moraniibacteriota bacterium]